MLVLPIGLSVTGTNGFPNVVAGGFLGVGGGGDDDDDHDDCGGGGFLLVVVEMLLFPVFRGVMLLVFGR